MAWSVALDFGDTTGARDITSYVNLDSFRRMRVFHNDLHAVSWSLSFGMVRNPTISTLLLGHEGDIDISVTKDGDSYFTGQLTTDYIVAIRTRLQEVPIKAVDNGERLRRVIKGDGAGGDIKWAGYKVCAPGDSAHSIVHQLLELAGITAAERDLGAGDTISSTIDYYVSLLGDKATYFDQLDQLLYEFGYLFHFTAGGKFKIADAYPADTSSGEMFDSGNMIGELAISRKMERYEAAQVTYYQHYTNTNVVLFRDTTGGEGALECHIAVEPGDFYPLGAGDGDVYCEYDGGQLTQVAPLPSTPTPGIGYGPVRKRKDIVQGQLICSNNVTLSTLMETGLVTNTFTDRYTRAILEIENTALAPKYITRLNIVGDATVATNPAIVESNNNANTDRIMSYESAYLTTKAQATRLAEGLEDYYRYSCLQYRWVSRTAAAMGDVVLIEDDVLGTSNIVRVTGAVDNEKYGTTLYTGEGLEAFVAGVVTQYSRQYAAAKALVAHELTVGAAGFGGIADLRCDGDTDESEIQEAIDHLVTWYGGGTVRLTEGTFHVDTAAIAMKSNVQLIGRGAGATIIEKNLNDYAIEAVGTSGTHLEKVTIRDMTVTRNVADSSSVDSVRVDYCDVANITGVVFDTVYSAVAVLNSSSIGVNNNTIIDCSFGIYLSAVSGIVSGNMITSTGPFSTSGGGIHVLGASGVKIINNTVADLEARTNYIGILLEECEEATVSGNVIDSVTGNASYDGEDASAGIMTKTSCVTTVVSGNRVDNLCDYSIAAGASGVVAINIAFGTGLVVSNNTCRNNGNLILRGNCESATPPYLTGETDDNNTNCTFARSSDFAHNGTYSYKYTKTNAAGTGAWSYFHDHESATTNDMAGLVAGCSYTMSAYVYIPTASGIDVSEVVMELYAYYSAGWNLVAADTATALDEWELLTFTGTLPAATTGIYLRVRTPNTAAINEYFYVDDIRVRPDGVHNEHGQNFSDAGTGTMLSGNSWQNPFPV